MAESYYYVDGSNNQAGPVDVAQMRTLVTQKEITGTTLLWGEGLADWTALNDIPALKSKVMVIPSSSRNSPLPPVSGRGGASTGAGRGSSAASVSGGSAGGRGATGGGRGAGMSGSAAVTVSSAGMATQSSGGGRGAGMSGTAAVAVSGTGGGRGAAGGRGGGNNSQASYVNSVANKTSVRNGYGTVPDQPQSVPQSGRTMARNSMRANWVEKMTADGVPYYYNASAEQVSWDKPDCLKTPEELANDQGEWVWISDETEGWLPARITNRSGRSVNVAMQNGNKKSVETAKEPLWPLALSSLARLEDDLVMVDSINQGLMMYSLKERYKHDQIYTWVGANHSVLVSVNPFKQLPIYTVNVMHSFAKKGLNRLDPPHTFALANSALTELKLESINQSILISGESGAGKTEATKQCLAFLAEIAGSSTNVEQKILQANPVLEAFGNAKTLRNNNSSRFGRWMEVHFDPRGGIIGSRIENYLLEKSRVVRQKQGERSYHILYQLCVSDIARQYQLGRADSYRYIGMSGCTSVAGIDDVEDFNDVKNAFLQLSFRQEEIAYLYETLASVLHIGNIAFQSDGGEGSSVDRNSQQVLRYVSQFLKVREDKLGQALTSRSIEVRGEINRIMQRPQEAIENADCLAKATYGRMFDWLVQRINQAVEGSRGRFIGILDIFGFEIFDNNGFEQLCINFTNEKLQQHFNKHTFKEEEETYQSEGIQFERVPFIDNQPVLDLIEKKPYGLLTMLDEEVILPQGTDEKWLAKVDAAHRGTAVWLSDQGARTQLAATSFGVQHYAGLVRYDCVGMVEKNRDSLFRDLYDLLSESTSAITRSLFPVKDKNPRKKTETLAGHFRSQLSSLMVLVDETEPRYIRCIKPNDEKKANTFKTRQCIDQLTYSGVFEAVQIRKNGYPFRLTHQRFAYRYRPLARKETGWVNLNVRNGDHKGMVRALLGCVNQDFSGVQMGNTMVLYRSEEHRILELLRNLTLERVVPCAQRKTRVLIGRHFRKAIRQVDQISAATMKQFSCNVQKLEAAITQCNEIMSRFNPIYNYEPPSLTLIKDRRFKMEERVKLTAIFRQLVSKNPDNNYGEFVDAVKRADAIIDMPGSSEEMQVEARVRDMLANSAGAKIDPWAREALYMLDRGQMEAVSEEALKFRYASAEIIEIRAKLELSETEFVKLQLKRANEMGDPDRIVNREVRLKEMFLELHGTSFAFDRCSMLRDPIDWATDRMFGLAMNKQELAASMLVHSTNPIHQSLTDLQPALDKEATKQFKNIMGWMGDRKYSYPDTLAQEVLTIGLQITGLRSELFAQLMKQLTHNPSPESENKGWELMSLLLICFPPPETFENFLAIFLRDHGPSDKRQQFTVAMHRIIYGGARSTPPTLADVPKMIADFFRRPVTARFNRDDLVALRSQIGETKASGGGRTGGGNAGRGGASTTGSSSSSSARGGPPTPQPVAASNTAICMYDYVSGGQEGMMDLRKGDLVTIMDSSDPDWWMAQKGSRQGWVPANYVRMN